MLNYQKFHYDAYYLENKDGDFIRCSRRDCFARAEKPTKDNPWKQRWYYDPDQSMAIRLARTKENDTIHRFNQAWLKREERYDDVTESCVWKDTSNCDQNCVECNRKNMKRVIRLDKGWDSSEELEFQVPDDFDLEELFAESVLIKELLSTLDDLSSDEYFLLKALYVDERTHRDYASELGISHQAVGKRKNKLINELKAQMKSRK